MAGISRTAVLAPEKREQISVTQSRGRAEGEERPKKYQEFILLQSVFPSQLHSQRGLNTPGERRGTLSQSAFPAAFCLAQPKHGWFLTVMVSKQTVRSGQRLKAALKRKEHGS